MHRWAECPGSVRLSKNAPPKTSAYAEEGTMAHELAAEVLEKGWPARPLDADLKDAVGVYVDFVASLLKTPQTEMLVEHRFDLSSLYPGLFGTADCVVYDRIAKRLYVIDYKHGAGVPVEVADNSQLKYYALGALMTCGFPAREIVLVIVQPRCPHPDGPVRAYAMESVDLIDFSSDLVKYAKATEDESAPLKPGSHCRFCPASGFCSALANKALIAAKEQFSAIAPYDAEKLSKTLDLLPVIEEWIKGVREFAYSEAQHGRVPPGFKLVPKRATRKWRDESEAAKRLWNHYGLKDQDMYDAPKIKSPAQIEKLFSKQVDKQVFNDLVVQESSGQTLVHESDKRPAVIPAALTQFAVVRDGE